MKLFHILIFIFFHFFIKEVVATTYPITTISEISPQGDWNMWLLGYRITLDDGSVWFSERGPIDTWDWETNDRLIIEKFSDQNDRRLIRTGWKAAMGPVDFRIFNIDRGNFDEFQLLVASSNIQVTSEGGVMRGDEFVGYIAISSLPTIQKWLPNDPLIIIEYEGLSYLFNHHRGEQAPFSNEF